MGNMENMRGGTEQGGKDKKGEQEIIAKVTAP